MRPSARARFPLFKSTPLAANRNRAVDNLGRLQSGGDCDVRTAVRSGEYEKRQQREDHGGIADEEGGGHQGGKGGRVAKCLSGHLFYLPRFDGYESHMGPVGGSGRGFPVGLTRMCCAAASAADRIGAAL